MTLKNQRYRRTLLAVASGTLLSALALTPLGSLLNTGHLSKIVPAAHAQAVTDEDVSNYARAIAAIEGQRKTAYAAASDVLAAATNQADISETPLSCQAHQLKDMPKALSKSERVSLLTVLVNFCREARSTAAANNLTPEQFNSITAAQQEDTELASRIKTAISKLPAG